MGDFSSADYEGKSEEVGSTVAGEIVRLDLIRVRKVGAITDIRCMH